MTTLNDLINDVHVNLHVNQGNAEQRTHLLGNIDADDLTFTVGDASRVSQGLIEIDDELLWVDSVDRLSNTVTVAPFGRGYQSTTAAAHTTNTQVLNNPRFSRSVTARTLREVASQVYPSIFRVRVDTTQSYSPAVTSYSVPADCDFVLSVSWQTIGPTGMWAPVKTYRLDRMASTASFTTGRSIDVLDSITPGRSIKIAYVAPPGELSTVTTTLADVGISESCRDVLVWGACARLIQTEEATRVQTASVEQSARDTVVLSGDPTKASRAFYALFQQRLQEEGDQLRALYPTVAHVSW